ncbi:MAG: hypothetical protein ABSA11_13415 [Candidatus Bathyarchaeia archaeon]|jgi:hypothetical protein
MVTNKKHGSLETLFDISQKETPKIPPSMLIRHAIVKFGDIEDMDTITDRVVQELIDQAIEEYKQAHRHGATTPKKVG